MVPFHPRDSQLSRMEVMALSLVEAARRGLPTLFYRIDAAAAEMVHENSPAHSGPMYKTLKPAILFPVVQEFPFRPAGG